MKIKIKVTKEILEASKDCGLFNGPVSQNCAIALAVREIWPSAAVGSKIHPFGSPDTEREDLILLPNVVCDFIRDFDFSTPSQRVRMQPIEFEVDVPDTVINRIGIGEVYRILSESRTLELV